MIVVSGLNGFAGLIFGERAHMSEPERVVMSDPMQRMFERASPETLAVISVYMDPLAFGIGFIAWLARIWREVREESEGDERPGPGAPPAEPGPLPGGDGRKPIEELEPVEGPASMRVIELTPEELRRPAGSSPFARGVS